LIPAALCPSAPHEGGERRNGHQSAPLVSYPISQTFSIESFELYPRTVKVKRSFSGDCPEPPERTGSQIQGFSDKSKGRLRFVATNSGHLIKTQFCMTYGDVWPLNGRVLKADFNRFRAAVKKHFPDLAYIWIAEFQTRGCPHYHFYSNIPRTNENHATLARIWHRIAGYDQAKHHAVHMHRRNFIEWDMGTGSYLCKYLDKEAQKYIPEGFKGMGRWWGNSRGIVPQPDNIDAEWLDTNYSYEYLDYQTGEFTEFIPSKWIMRQIGRYQEKQFKKRRRCWFRRTTRSTQSLTGSPIFERLLQYLQQLQPPEEQPPF
jgi:hypothetical protein